MSLLRCLCLGLLLAAATAGAAEFANPIVPTCLQPVDATAGDFDQDGLADLAVACRFSGQVALFRGDGKGAFTAWPSVAVADPVALRVADFNGDELPDIVVAAEDSVGVSLLLGNGDGSFQTPIGYGAGTRPSDLALADLDADGQADVVVANLGSSDLSLFEADGLGALQLVEHVTTGDTSRLAAGDFDDDGTPDVVATHAGQEEIFVLWGDGAGSLSAPVTLPAGGFAFDVATGDLDGDGIDDIVVVAAGSSNRITALFSNGNGSFQAPVELQAVSFPRWVAVADMNLDGAADIVAAVNVPNRIQILPGNGDGSFGPPWSAPLGSDAETVVIAEMNGDGRPDVLAPRGLGGEDLSVLFGKGDGTLDVPPLFATDVPAASVAAADLDDDGYTDVVVAGNQGQDKGYGALLGDGLGAFVVADQVQTASFPQNAVLSKLDGDAHLDLSMTTFNGISVLLGVGDGTFGAETNVPVTNARTHVTGRWDADPHTDLAALDPFDDEIVLLFGDGAGGFAGETIVSIPPSADFLLRADLTGEGHADLIVDGFDINFGSLLAILLGNGDGTFSQAPLLSLDSGASSAAVADFDEDGLQDLAVVENGDRLRLFPGNGDGTFDAAGPDRSFQSGLTLVAKDLDGDGHLDLVTTGRGGVSVLYGLGDGTFAEERRFGAGRYPSALAVAEVSDDGMPDVLASDAAGGFAALIQRGAFLSWASDDDALLWRSVTEESAYNVYRGDIADLGGGNGYGACVTQSAGTSWSDFQQPLQDAGYFYLVTYVTAAAELGAGHTGSGQPRVLPPACP